MNESKKKIVTIGGGTGQFVLLSGLRDIEAFDLAAIVSMSDSGGSTGRLRDELDVLPPGDILKCLLALSPYRDTAQSILLKRFKAGTRLKGHNAGNILLSVLSQYTGSFMEGVQALTEILDVRGNILPVTLNKTTLVAELTDGTHVFGETGIDIPKNKKRAKIKDIFLFPHSNDSIFAYPPVLRAISEADFIIIGPGDLFTSIAPNLIVPGVKEALQNTKANILYIINIMNKYGETEHFHTCDFINEIEKLIGKNPNGVIYNTQKPLEILLKRYKKVNSEFVEPTVNSFVDKQSQKPYKLYEADLLMDSKDTIRHDSAKMASLLKKIIL